MTDFDPCGRISDVSRFLVTLILNGIVIAPLLLALVIDIPNIPNIMLPSFVLMVMAYIYLFTSYIISDSTQLSTAAKYTFFRKWPTWPSVIDMFCDGIRCGSATG
ncbi:hypothetical protein BS17DRAFT_375362 [Gyrodon lividus]|nr:hypothetical protein BS17DRAFT_375362 [Gyrodon lividus]